MTAISCTKDEHSVELTRKNQVTPSVENVRFNTANTDTVEKTLETIERTEQKSHSKLRNVDSVTKLYVRRALSSRIDSNPKDCRRRKKLQMDIAHRHAHENVSDTEQRDSSTKHRNKATMKLT